MTCDFNNEKNFDEILHSIPEVTYIECKYINVYTIENRTILTTFIWNQISRKEE